ncbi:MAG: P-II family nitrogen regulator [Oscillospiraceae bacterium]|nr:P-II family nitrogen regulator [Oscillospiraceae bacterium]
MENKIVYSLIVAILNRGFSGVAMDAARNAGAKGGTVISAHGSGLHEDETFFGISILPEKEIVLILSSEETKPSIMRAIIKRVGIETEGGGIAFSLPVTEVEGISRITDFEENKQ